MNRKDRLLAVALACLALAGILGGFLITELMR